ncbi:MAG: YggT family protein, partial [Candidatus Yanofskybacteria bacterium]|nr:YggT family protein [Candidatus Yanofskybacteria bacterium]
MPRIITTNNRPVYERDSDAGRSVRQVIWFLFYIVGTLLLFRFFLQLIGANPSAGFTNFVYNATAPLVAPFRGVVGSTAVNTGIVEWSTVVAFAVYWIAASILSRLFSPARDH